MKIFRITYIYCGQLRYRDFPGSDWYSIVSTASCNAIDTNGIVSIEVLPLVAG